MMRGVGGMRRALALVALVVAVVMMAASRSRVSGAAPRSAQAPGSAGPVYVVPVSGPIEGGLARFVVRSLDAAEAAGARAVILEISTPGGRIDSALAIKERVARSSLMTVAFVKDRAWSAGALITLICEKVAMAPGSSIGSAEPRPLDEKTLSAWRAELEAAAEKWGRDPRLAAAMADSNVEIPGIKEKGKLLNLTAGKALELRVADVNASGRDEVLSAFGLAGAPVVEMRPNAAELLARFSTHPYVAPALLTLGILGLAAEILTAGFGLPGVIGVVAFALYFGGQALLGFTGWQVALLFIAGLILLAVEAFLPGFGVFGFSGIACLALSIYFALGQSGEAVGTLVVALVASILILGAMLRVGLKRGWWRRISLGEASTGRLRPSERPSLVGKKGTALTPLRPAGVAEIEGTRVDVITDGEFIGKGEAVQVVRDEGLKVVVRRADSSNSTNLS